MKNTLLAAVAAITFTTAAVAGEQPAGDKNFGGAHIAALVGYGSTVAKVGNVATVDYGLKGATGGVEVGFGKVLPNSMVFLGIKASALASGVKGDIADVGTFKAKNAFNIAARLGLVYGNAMPFVEAGWERAKIEFTPTDGAKASANVSGLLLGLGVDVLVSKNVVLGVAFNNVSYGKKTISEVGTKVNASRGMFKIGYKF